MVLRNIADAKAELSALLVLVEQGEEVIIARSGKPIARLVLIKHGVAPRKLGALKGKLKVSEDFDEYSADVRELFEGKAGK